MARFYLLGVLLVALSLSGCSGPSAGGTSAAAAEPDWFRAGEIVTLSGSEATTPVLVAGDGASYDRLMTCAAAQDTIGLAGMFLAGAAWQTPAGTRARVLDHQILGFRVEVRLESGPEAGRAGFVADHLVHR